MPLRQIERINTATPNVTWEIQRHVILLEIHWLGNNHCIEIGQVNTRNDRYRPQGEVHQPHPVCNPVVQDTGSFTKATLSIKQTT